MLQACEQAGMLASAELSGCLVASSNAAVLTFLANFYKVPLPSELIHHPPVPASTTAPPAAPPPAAAAGSSSEALSNSGSGRISAYASPFERADVAAVAAAAVAAASSDTVVEPGVLGGRVTIPEPIAPAAAVPALKPSHSSGSRGGLVGGGYLGVDSAAASHLHRLSSLVRQDSTVFQQGSVPLVRQQQVLVQEGPEGVGHIEALAPEESHAAASGGGEGLGRQRQQQQQGGGAEGPRQHVFSGSSAVLETLEEMMTSGSLQ